MQPAFETESHRPTMVYSIDGLSAKDLILFKSFVRLLDHRTQHHWVFRPEQADLHVVADGMAAKCNGTPTLVVGSIRQQLGHFLRLPIHADALEQELNLLGTLIAVGRARKLTEPSTVACAASAVNPAPPPALVHVAMPPCVATGSLEVVRLVRWPSAQLLGSPERLRLATLMTGKPVSLALVQQRSGVEPGVCASFVSELKSAGLLSSENVEVLRHEAAPAAQPAPEVAARVQPGLLARIRRRLGLPFARHG